MARPQHGIFAEGTSSHHHIELHLLPDASPDTIRAAISTARAVGADHRANGGVHLVIGFGPDAWELLRGPADATAVRAFEGYRTPDGTHQAPATQRDLWLWVHGPGPDVVVDVARRAVAALASVAAVELDVPAFVYKDSRDMTGFIDGTANPLLDEALDIATVPDGQTGQGGCAAMTMRFVHDLDAFESLAIGEQEQVFGRTKIDSVELEGDDKPDDAHISRTEVDGPDGEELEVYRRSVPWATATAQGLVFVSFAPTIERFDLQLRRMYGLGDDALVDRLLEFTAAWTGSFWWCPSAADLDLVAPLPDEER